MRGKDIALFIYIVFSISLVGFYAYSKYQEGLKPQIILKSDSNPVFYPKPEIVDSSLNLIQIEEEFKNLEIENDNLLEIDLIQ